LAVLFAKKITLGRHMHMWQDNIKMDLEETTCRMWTAFNCMKFKALAAMGLKMTAYWDIAPSSP
jgi:hypothetical protein